jgi:hypothetical protein
MSDTFKAFVVKEKKGTLVGSVEMLSISVFFPLFCVT